MKKLILIATLLTASLSFAADAKDKKKAAAATAAATATKLDVTGGLKWTGYGVGKSHGGDLAFKSGSIEMKGEQIVGGTFVIDMTTLKTGDSEKLQGHLMSPDFFDVQKFPEATFKITKVELAKTGGTHKITGDLTIKGKTHSETFMANVAKEGMKWTAKADTEIKDRTQYDIVYNSAKFKAASALGDKLIEDKIKVELNLATK